MSITPEWMKRALEQSTDQAATMHAIEERRRAGHGVYLLDHLMYHAGSGDTFDVTFYRREPILETTLDKRFARKLWAAFVNNSNAGRIKQLLQNVTFDDGTAIDAAEIWIIVPIPPDLNTANVDLSQGDEVAGFGGETIRQMISNAYHCRSRAEEDFFLARWIAS